MANLDNKLFAYFDFVLTAISEDEYDTKNIRRRIPTNRKTAFKTKLKFTKNPKRSVIQKRFKIEPLSDLDDDEVDPLYNTPAAKTFESSFNLRERRTCRITERMIKQEVLEKPIKKTKRVKKPRNLICSENCKYECASNFNNKLRKILCERFWSMNSAEQDNFLKQSIDIRKTQRLCLKKTNRPRREFMCRYFLSRTDGEKLGVCSVFFHATLSLRVPRVKKILSKVWNSINEMKENQSMEFEQEEEVVTDVKSDANTTENKCIEEVLTPKPKSVERRKVDLSRKLRPANCEAIKCRYNCTSKINEEQRAKLCEGFWSLDFKRRKDYLISHVQSHAIITKTLEEFRKGNRPRSHQNHFFLRSQNGENVRVCSRFFAATLSLGSNYINRTLRRSDPTTGTYIGDDMRGRKEAYNKTSPELREDVKRHIESYPTWVPNKRSKTRYLDSTLSVQKMFNEYKEKCIVNGMKFVNPTYFRRVFRDDFRLAFLRPNVGSPRKVSAAKRTRAALENPKVTKVKAPNAFLSEYTGNEGGFWSTSDNIVELSSPIKEITVTTTIERATVLPQQNIVFPTGASPSSSNLISYTNFNSISPKEANLQILQEQQQQQQQSCDQSQEILLEEQIELRNSGEQLNTSDLVCDNFNEQAEEVFGMM